MLEFARETAISEDVDRVYIAKSNGSKVYIYHRVFYKTEHI